MTTIRDIILRQSSILELKDNPEWMEKELKRKIK
jgi:hypothetical protein